MTQNGADIFIESLKAEGVEVIFGYPGGAVLHIYDAIQRHAFPHILCRQEAAGVHMADGYARSTGKTGVALVTSGPRFVQRHHRHCHRLFRFDSHGDL